MLTRRLLSLATVLVLPAMPAAGQQPEPIDQAAVEILRRHGLDDSRVMEHLSWICDVHGGRLTGSPNLRRAQEWAAETLANFGLENVRFEPWGPFGRGWQLDRFSMHVVGENPWPVLAWPKAWSPGTDGELVAEVVNADAMDAEALRAMDLSDKIVLLESARDLSEWFDGSARRLDAADLLELATGASRVVAPTPATANAPRADFRSGFQRRQAVMAVLRENRPLMLLDRSYKGDYGTIFVTGASALPPKDESGARRARDPGAEVIPQVTLAAEHYNRIVRLAELGQKVTLAVSMDVTFLDGDLMERNVTAEIPGSDPEIGDEVVMIGAHFDSWHSGSGATDNGVGSAVMIEAMRLLRALVTESGQRPRRTIRIALWSGEEQGLLGSRAYVAQHFGARGTGRGEPPTNVLPEHDKLAGYFNLDNGTGRIRGVYLQGNDACAPIFRAWLEPFHDLEAATLTRGNTGGTDHLSFDAVGLPGFQFIQDPVAYGTRTHHSSMDVWDHAIAEDLRQAATIIAAFAWHGAQRDDKLPRKPFAVEASAVGGGR